MPPMIRLCEALNELDSTMCQSTSDSSAMAKFITGTLNFDPKWRCYTMEVASDRSSHRVAIILWDFIRWRVLVCDKVINKLTSVSQGQGPQTEVRGGVRYAAEHVLDRVNGLMDHDVAEVLQFTGFFEIRGVSFMSESESNVRPYSVTILSCMSTIQSKGSKLSIVCSPLHGVLLLHLPMSVLPRPFHCH